MAVLSTALRVLGPRDTPRKTDASAKDSVLRIRAFRDLVAADSASGGLSRLPRLRGTCLMKNREDFDLMAIEYEVHGIWKAPHQDASRVACNWYIGRWSLGSFLDGEIELENELNTKAWALSFVPRSGLFGVGTRLLLDAESVQMSRSFAKSSSRTSAQACPVEGFAW
jgi:hypothetical protein